MKVKAKLDDAVARMQKIREQAKIIADKAKDEREKEDREKEQSAQ